MRLLSGVLTFLLASAVPVLSAEPAEWGKTLNGLRMGIALVNVGFGEPQVVEITIENVGGQTPVVQIRECGDTQGRLTLQACSDAGAEWVTLRTSGCGIGSPASPLLVPLLPRSRYQIRRQTGDYGMTLSRVSLGKFLLGIGPHWLRADLRVGKRPDYSPVPSVLAGRPLPSGCIDEEMLWEGALNSNILRFPARRQK